MGSYALVRKRDLLVMRVLTSEQSDAIRAVENGAKDEHQKAIVLEVMNCAHKQRLWLGCDCRRDGDRRLVVTPCLSNQGNYFWKVLGEPQLKHARECVFHRSHLRREDDGQWSRAARQPPEGYVAVLHEEAPGRQLSEGRRHAEGERRWRNRARPALSRWLLRLMQEARLDRVETGDEFGHPGK